MTPTNQFIFPFGQILNPVVQTDVSPKKVFVLGVYASAVHARWNDKDGNQLVAALAVASEPEIFWTGHDTQLQIDKIAIPEEAGKLVLPNVNLNGPSGRALDELYLKPLGLTRKDAWLCDLIPETRLNPHQKNAIIRSYKPLMKNFNLPKVTIPEFRQGELTTEQRRQEILKELFDSHAETLILLGDLPIKWFLNYFSDTKNRTLASFGETPESYGLAHKMKIDGKTFSVIPLCHPRQAQRLGASSKNWFDLHRNWVKKKNALPGK
jgi:uracil-DNA glycosylase